MGTRADGATRQQVEGPGSVLAGGASIGPRGTRERKVTVRARGFRRGKPLDGLLLARAEALGLDVVAEGLRESRPTPKRPSFGAWTAHTPRDTCSAGHAQPIGWRDRCSVPGCPPTLGAETGPEGSAQASRRALR